mgnify:CR=1 FL=1
MSILANKARTIKEMPIDSVYVIYGAPGSGKTHLASTFPKTPQAPMLYLDILEGGTGSISAQDADNIQVISVTTYEELDEIMVDLERGYAIDEQTKTQKPLKFSTIVFDSVTQLEYLMKAYLKSTANKSSMTLQLWGQAKDNHESLWNMCKPL